MPTHASVVGILLASFLFASGNAPALDLSGFSNKDQIGSLKQALTQGAETAVTNLARENGYLGNDRVRIPLPESLQKVDRAMERVGLTEVRRRLVGHISKGFRQRGGLAQALVHDPSVFNLD